MIRGFCKMIKNLYVILSCFLNGKETELILSRLLSWLFSCVDDARWVRSLEPFSVGLNPPQAAVAGKLRRRERAENQSGNQNQNEKTLQG